MLFVSNGSGAVGGPGNGKGKRGGDRKGNGFSWPPFGGDH
jgi:hypothetical protein